MNQARRNGAPPFKRSIGIFTAVTIIICMLSGCGGVSSHNNGKIRIVTTIFPEYDWIRQIIGEDCDNVELTLLTDNGADIHSYQPSVSDIVRISTCDMFVYVGGESDEWVRDILRQSQNSGTTVVNLLGILGSGVKEEAIIDDMQAEKEAMDGRNDEPEYDEHVWLSLKNAAVVCGYITDILCGLDGENSGKYIANAKAYTEKINELDKKYQDKVDNAGTKTLLFGDRFPFRYMTEDYGLDYYAAFPGCSAETEASFKTIAYLSGKIDELGLHSIIKLEGSGDDIAQTIKDNTLSKDQKILILDPMQSVTAEDISGGMTYLSVMESNLAVLGDALN